MAHEITSDDSQKTVSADRYRLAKAVGIGAVMASALTQEYGAGINLVAPNSAGAYPGIEYLVPAAMVACGILLLPKLALFMRFSAHMPSAGSTYAWIGRSLSLPIAFVVTFLWWVGLGGSLGVLGFAFGTFLANAFAVAGWPGAVWLTTAPGELVLGLGIIWFFVLINSLGVRSYGEWVKVLAGLIVVTAAVVIGYGFTTDPSQFLASAGSAEHLHLAPPANPAGPSVGAFFSVAAVFVFAYGGLTAAPALGGEVRNSKRDLPGGLFLAWAAAVVLFSLVTLAIFHAAPWWAVADLVHHGDASVVTVPGLIGLVAPHVFAVIIDLVTAVIVGKTVNPALMAMSRTVFGWGEDHVLPAAFARTSSAKAPVAALVLSALVGSAFLAETVIEGFTLGVVIRSLSILVVVAVVAAGLLNMRFVQRRRFAGKSWAESISRGWGIVIAAVLGIAVSAVFIASTVTSAGKPLYLQPWLEAVVAAGVGVILWYWAAWRARQSDIDLRAAQAAPPLE